jgi:TonB-linked SusC/RagA family outer membrane protein
MNKMRTAQLATGSKFAGLCVATLLALGDAADMQATNSAVPQANTAVQNASAISGIVYEKATGEPIVGASIAITKNGKVIEGVVTDVDGKFKMASPGGAYEVTVSFVGMKKQVFSSKKGSLNNLQIYLEDNNAFEEVVVTGYVNKNKKSFTGAVTQMKGDDLKMVTGTNIITAIAALTPGMSVVQNSAQGSNPNHVEELVLRGTTSFSNSGQDVNQPTIILDGTEISMSELYDLDMNEVESINVLKDASATALYGSKAANGVIVITRKPIKTGSLRVQYNFTGNLQFPKLNDYHVLNASDKLKYEKLAGLYDANGAIDSSTGLPSQYALDELYNERYKRVAAGINSDWLSQPARTALTEDHSLRIYGGAENIRYELSGRFGDTRGVMKGDYRKRYNVGFKLDYYIKNSIQISNRSTYAIVDTKDTPYGSFSQYTQMNPYDEMYNADGSANTNLSWDVNNPLYEAQLGSYSKSGTTSFSNNTDIRWDINTLFRLTGHLNISSSGAWSDSFTSPKSLYYKNETDLTKKGQLITSNTRTNSYDANVLGSFNKMFKDESLISASIGWEVSHDKTLTQQTEAIGFFNDKLSYIGNAAGYPSDQQPSGSQAETASVGAFLTANYSFRNRYFIDGSWRMTGSSQFGENNRWGNFWSLGAGWNLLNESFLKDLKGTIDLMKLRFSAGYTGKVSFSAYQAMTMYKYLNTYEYKNGIGAVPITIGDVDLSWERTMSYNLGLDYSMFDHRLNFVIDAYIKNTTDLLLDKTLAPSTGVTSATSNLGEMQNRGIEFQVDGYIFRHRDFSWKIGTTGYANRNKITKINSALEQINQENEAMSSTSLTPLPQYAEGESTTALKLVRSAGIDPATGKEVYIKRNGELTFEYDSSDKVLIGDTEPAYIGTFNTNLYWKGFSVYALFNFRLGAWIYNTTRVSKVEGSNPKYNADQRVFDNRWKQAGDVALYKDIADSSRPEQTDRFAEKENTLTLSSLNFSYEFSDKICHKIRLKQLRCGINFTDILRLSTVKIERGTDYLYSQGFEFYANITF